LTRTTHFSALNADEKSKLSTPMLNADEKSKFSTPDVNENQQATSLLEWQVDKKQVNNESNRSLATWRPEAATTTASTRSDADEKSKFSKPDVDKKWPKPEKEATTKALSGGRGKANCVWHLCAGLLGTV
jgi:hypothetical protein